MVQPCLSEPFTYQQKFDSHGRFDDKVLLALPTYMKILRLVEFISLIQIDGPFLFNMNVNCVLIGPWMP